MCSANCDGAAAAVVVSSGSAASTFAGASVQVPVKAPYRIGRPVTLSVAKAVAPAQPADTVLRARGVVVSSTGL